jgi:integrase
MLTDRAIKKLPLPQNRREVPDGRVTGLYLVLQSSGAKSWALRYRSAGVPRKLTLGGYPTLSIAEARRRAQKALGALAGGNDPAADKKATREALRAAREADADSIERVVALYVQRHAKLKIKRSAEVERVLNKEVVERWKGRRLSQITRAQIHDMLDSIVDRGAPIRANRVFEQFRSLCKWAIGRGIIDRNPCEEVKAPSPETKRERVLDDTEIGLVWQAFEKVGWPFGKVGQLLLLTGAREREVAGMEWKEIDLTSRTWTLPATRAKNKREHVVPLSDAAVEIISGLPRLEARKFVFSVTGRTSVSGFSNAKKKVNGAMAESIPHWTFHDLRRTVATNLQKLGVRLEVTEACLNHVGGSRAGIVGLYQRHDWKDEKRAALQAWARKLEEIVSGEKAANVVELASARAP